MDPDDLQVSADECLFHLLVEVADMQSSLDCLLAKVSRLSAQMPEESQTQTQTQMQITFHIPAGGPARDLWIKAGVPEQFTQENLGDAFRAVELYVLSQPNYKEILGGKRWLSFLYGLFENSFDALELAQV